MSDTIIIEGGRRMKLRRLGEGPPLLCLGGLTQTTANWTSAGRALAELGHGVLLTDLPGQAGTEPLPSGTPHAQAEVVLGLLDALGLEQIDLCGFSYGGRVALQAAHRWPERVRRLVLTSTSMGTSPVAALVVDGWLRAIRSGGLEAMGEVAMPWIIGEKLLRQVPVEQMVRATVRRNSVEGIESLILGILHDVAPPVAELAMPTLLVAGSHDRFAMAADQQRLAMSGSGLSCRVFDGLGHTVPVEATLYRPQSYDDRRGYGRARATRLTHTTAHR